MTLSCDVDGNPVPTISWTRDGSPVNTSATISISDDHTHLTITNVKRADNGNYRCVANNSLGSATSNAATLNVHCKYSVLWSKPSSWPVLPRTRNVRYSQRLQKTRKLKLLSSLISYSNNQCKNYAHRMLAYCYHNTLHANFKLKVSHQFSCTQRSNIPVEIFYQVFKLSIYIWSTITTYIKFL